MVSQPEPFLIEDTAQALTYLGGKGTPVLPEDRTSLILPCAYRVNIPMKSSLLIRMVC